MIRLAAGTDLRLIGDETAGMALLLIRHSKLRCLEMTLNGEEWHKWLLIVQSRPCFPTRSLP